MQLRGIMSVVPLRETDTALPRGWRHFLQGSSILGTEVFWAFLTTYPQDVPLTLHVLIYKMSSLWFFLRHTYLPASSITAVLFSMFSLLLFYQLQGLESKFLIRKHKVRWGDIWDITRGAGIEEAFENHFCTQILYGTKLHRATRK